MALIPIFILVTKKIINPLERILFSVREVLVKKWFGNAPVIHNGAFFF